MLEPKAHPPLIPSQLSATLAVEKWAKGHTKVMLDADGLPWHLHYSKKQRPASDSTRDLDWEITVQLKTEATVDALIGTQTLDPQADARLIEILRGHSIPFVIKPLSLHAKHEEQVYRLANQSLPSYVEKIQQGSLKALKRQAIGRYVDAQFQFGHNKGDGGVL